MTPPVAQPAVELTGKVKMPLVGFGTWQATGEEGYEAVRVALETGYRHIDTATMYGNEAEVGRALRDSGLPREDVFLTTKLPPERAGMERATLDASLAALGTEYLDLWLIHWPPRRSAGLETWREFLAARDEGLVRAVGVSNYSTEQLDVLIDSTGQAPAVNQIRWSPSFHDPQRLTDNRRRGVVLEGYSPFKSTNLHDPVLIEIADGHGVTTAQVVLRWHLEHEVVVIPKSATPERIRENFEIFGFALTPEEMEQIDALGG